MLVLFTRVQRLSDQNHFGYDQRVDKSRPIRKIGDLKLGQRQRAVRGQRAEEESKIAGQDHNFLDLMHSGLLFSAIWKSLVFGVSGVCIPHSGAHDQKFDSREDRHGGVSGDSPGRPADANGHHCLHVYPAFRFPRV